MKTQKFFMIGFVAMALICSFVLFASAQMSPTMPDLAISSTPEKKAVSVGQPITVFGQCDELDADENGDPFDPTAPVFTEALLTIPFDPNVSKNYTVIYNLRQFANFYPKKLLIKSRSIEPDFVPLPVRNGKSLKIQPVYASI